MQISVRSYLTVSTATVVGAGAIALTPVVPGGAVNPANLPAPAVAEVSLTGLSFSLPDIVGLLGDLNIGGWLPDLGGLSPDLARAVVSEFIKLAAPVVKDSAGDVLQYVGSAVTGLVVGPDSIPVRFGSAIAEVPSVVKAAIGELRDGGIGAALMTLNAGLLAPLASVGQAVKDVAVGIISFVETQVGAFVAAVPGLLASAIAAVIGNNSQGLLDAIKNAVDGLFGGLRPAAAVSVASSVALPAVTDTVPAIEEAPAPAASSRVPGAAAAGVAAAPAAAEPAAEAESESPAAQVATDPTAAPVTRPSAASVRSASTEEVSSDSAATTRSGSGLRSNRNSGERPRAAAAPRSE